jgi:hypothetical protein
LCCCLLWIGRLVARRVPAWRPGCCEHEAWLRNPFVCDSNERQSTITSQRIWTALHWFSAGTTSFARGLTELMYLDIDGISIEVADHCYGCTAGQGSGCNGAFGALDIEAGGQV